MAPSLRAAAPSRTAIEFSFVEVSAAPNHQVGKLDGGRHEVVVAGAAKLVGKKATVTVGSACSKRPPPSSRTTSLRMTPITFEAMAES